MYTVKPTIVFFFRLKLIIGRTPVSFGKRRTNENPNLRCRKTSSASDYHGHCQPTMRLRKFALTSGIFTNVSCVNRRTFFIQSPHYADRRWTFQIVFLDHRKRRSRVKSRAQILEVCRSFDGNNLFRSKEEWALDKERSTLILLSQYFLWYAPLIDAKFPVSLPEGKWPTVIFSVNSRKK